MASVLGGDTGLTHRQFFKFGKIVNSAVYSSIFYLFELIKSDVQVIFTPPKMPLDWCVCYFSGYLDFYRKNGSSWDRFRLGLDHDGVLLMCKSKHDVRSFNDLIIEIWRYFSKHNVALFVYPGDPTHSYFAQANFPFSKMPELHAADDGLELLLNEVVVGTRDFEHRLSVQKGLSKDQSDALLAYIFSVFPQFKRTHKLPLYYLSFSSMNKPSEFFDQLHRFFQQTAQFLQTQFEKKKDVRTSNSYAEIGQFFDDVVAELKSSSASFTSAEHQYILDNKLPLRSIMLRHFSSHMEQLPMLVTLFRRLPLDSSFKEVVLEILAVCLLDKGRLSQIEDDFVRQFTQLFCETWVYNWHVTDDPKSQTAMFTQFEKQLIDAFGKHGFTRVAHAQIDYSHAETFFSVLFDVLTQHLGSTPLLQQYLKGHCALTASPFIDQLTWASIINSASGPELLSRLNSLLDFKYTIWIYSFIIANLFRMTPFMRHFVAQLTLYRRQEISTNQLVSQCIKSIDSIVLSRFEELIFALGMLDVCAHVTKNTDIQTAINETAKLTLSSYIQRHPNQFVDSTHICDQCRAKMGGKAAVYDVFDIISRQGYKRLLQLVTDNVLAAS